MTGQTFDADFLIVGSGPAGVSAAFPMIEAGRDVIMVDGSSWKGQFPPTAPSRSWARFLGQDLEGLIPEDGLSPRLRLPALKTAIDEYRALSGIHAEGFFPASTYSRGGLSPFWGGFVCEFDDADLTGWPISYADLAPSYASVTRRIGVSGSTTDAMARFLGAAGPLQTPPPLGPATSRLLENFQRQSSKIEDFALGRARNALLTEPLGTRLACDLGFGCHWGCDRGAIYDSRYDLKTLLKTGRLRMIDDARVLSIRRIADGWRAVMADGCHLHVKRVLLGGGPLSTTQLVLTALDDPPREIRLLSNPSIGTPLFMPGMLGQAPAERSHTLAQLCFRLTYGPEKADYLFGSLYEAAALPASFFVSRMPVGRRAGIELFRALAPALLVVGAFFPGSESNHAIRHEHRGGQIALNVQGGVAPDFGQRLAAVRARLARILKQLGAWTLPGGTLADLGTDIHYAGTLPMGGSSALATSSHGEVLQAPGLFVVDGSAFSTLPAKSLTLTIMANADRVGRHLSRQE